MTKEQVFEHPPRGHVALLAYDSANDRFQVVHVDANGLLQVDVAAVADPQANAHGYDGAAWRKQPPIWGYSDRVFEDLSEAAPSTGTWTQYSTAVPAGEVHRLEFMYVINDTRAGASVTFSAFSAGLANYFLYTTTVARYFPNTFVGQVTLKAGDRLRITMGGVTAGDVMKACVWGSKMSIAM